MRRMHGSTIGWSRARARPRTSTSSRTSLLGELLEIGEELRLHRTHRAGAVRELALGADARFGERHAELGREEERVVAKSAHAARRGEDRALAHAVGSD